MARLLGRLTNQPGKGSLHSQSPVPPSLEGEWKEQEQVVEPTRPGVGASQGTAGSLPSAAGGAPACPRASGLTGTEPPLCGDSPPPPGGEDRPLLAQL